jgi:hypothetical protein
MDEYCEDDRDVILDMGEAAQDTKESAQHIPQQTNGAGAEATLPPRCLITGCYDDAEPTSVFCAWHNIGR